jgi:peptidoglycan/LPS O-acetylase OafA/YrhL
MLMIPAAVLGIIGLMGAVVGGKIGGPLDLSFLAYADLFTLGMLLAVLRVEHEDGLLRLPRYWRVSAVVIALVTAAIAVWVGQSSHLPERGETHLMAIPCALLLALVVFPSSTRRSYLLRFLESAPVVAAGLASYSVYLWHKPIILFLGKHELLPHGGLATLAGSLAIVATVTGVFSWMTYRYVEKPPLRLKAKSRRPIEPAISASQEPTGRTVPAQ